MEKFNLRYSGKNIPIPSDSNYTIKLIETYVDFVNRIRWKAFFFLNKDLGTSNKETYGFKSNRKAPAIPLLEKFENDLLLMIENIKFRKVDNTMQKKLQYDTRRIKREKKIMVPADKTNNFYLVPKRRYDKFMKDSIRSDYRRADDNAEHDANLNAKSISEKLDLSDRMKVLAAKDAYVLFKDHKRNFHTHPSCRLINPTKTEIALISKQILDRINTSILRETQLNQWKNTTSVIEWFEKIRVRRSTTFLIFDIVSFYPSISKDLLQKAIQFAQNYTTVTPQEIEIIMSAKRTLLFHNKEPWQKSNAQDQFDVTMGSWDGAETCELIGIFLLHQIKSIIPEANVGLYRDDGLAVLNGTPRESENIKKKLCKLFNDLGLQITAEANKKVANFLDITLDLVRREFRPYSKPGSQLQYVHKDSNHPPSVKKQIAKSVEARLSTISSNESIFNEAKEQYQEALRKAGYQGNLSYQPRRSSSKKRSKKRSRKIVWFNPPFSQHVQSNIGEIFINLVRKHFHKRHPLRTIFNKNTLKLSYSCMPNMETIIKSHNSALTKTNNSTQSRQCDCRVKNECPLDNKCLTKNVVYEATVKTRSTEKRYIGMTSCTFKRRYYGHLSSFRHEENRHSTSLSNHIWGLKKSATPYSISWKIRKQALPYSPLTDRCNLCNWEKLLIITSNRSDVLNKRTELLSKCPHKRKYLLDDYG